MRSTYGGHNRLFEMIPGALVWFTFLGAIALSFARPLWAIYAVILFDLYWLFRVVYFIIFVVFSWNEYRRSLRIDWLSRLSREKADWEKIYHLVFLPMVDEPLSIVRGTCEALCATNYPNDKFIVVLAGEERAKEHFEVIAADIVSNYGSRFHELIITLHPSDIPGEIISKGANMSYAGTEAKKYIDAKGIPYEHVIVSAFDIDTIAHPDYFACLTHTYLSQKDPTRSSYQPVVLYNNNIWDSPAPMRLAALSTTFWLLTELARPDRLFTFSSHSMSFRALADVGFWQRDMVNEDSRIFLQCYLHYDSDYSVVPLYIPLSMDTVLAPTLFKSMVNLYKQQRRWAWGVEHFPYLLEYFLHDTTIPLGRKIYRLWLQIEGMYTWATAPVIILILGYLPLLLADTYVRTTIIAQNAPYILAWLMNLSMIGIFTLGILSFFLLPRLPARHDPYRYLYMVAQWVLLPVTIILFSALPAIDAQTRLMTGRYLGSFNVTEKMRKE
ncbi:glycosyltransferase family 2 protein [Candidatus Uhrbacteria bacterium]|nr:glycosyltransferase family 2 protein [Candidatus Uhrbacteria bacterium]